ncbi:protein FAR1-RELATED SEQUENCE 5-like [Papaver somniferum]|uniref:protein FAR1-RELATED SEQUENCE 5-like n=1 Tax=Papaver somniferum TaxID=3469 RepID=UPI000E6F6E30|nr:protein FAR1-RELATED SEQUENCE 5-like [Papaver somniferum]
MVCERGGKKVSKKKNGKPYVGKTGKKYKTKTRKINCPFKIVLKWNINEKVFKMNEDMDCRHNHPRPKDLHGHYRDGRLKAHEYAEVDKMTRARMAPSKILSKLKADDKNNKTTLQQIYNARSTLRRKDLQGRLVMQQLLWLAQKNNYACQKKFDEFGHVTHLFIAHPECVKLVLCFPQVLILDCTYKTNKYEIPLMNVVGHTSTKSPFTVAFCFLHDELKESYVWALEQVKLIFREDALPKVMVTDQEAALMFAIRKVFPNAQNFLCTFHVWNNVRKKCQGIIQPLKLKELEKIATLPDGEREVKKKEFRKSYEANERMWACFHNDWESLTWSITEEVYEENVAKLIANWGVKYPEIIIYLRKQFLDTNAHRFVSAFKNHHKHFDNQATSMVESAHYRLKRNLFGCVDTFVTVFDAMEDYFMSDVIRIGTLFEKSIMMKHDEFPDVKWLRGLTIGSLIFTLHL